MNDILNEISDNGIYEGIISKDMVNELDKNFMENIEEVGIFKPSYNQYFKSLDKNMPLFTQYLPLLDLYYGRKSKIRDVHAVLTLPLSETGQTNGHATKWHTDYENSVALMILLNDISMMDSHMEFIPKEKYTSGQRLNEPCLVDKKIKHCIGSAGTFFLFNNGHYLHRAKLLPGKIRKTLHGIYLPL